MTTQTSIRASVSGTAVIPWPAVAAVAAGLMLFLVAGFAWPEAIHAATHDMRHALGLPCH